MTKVYGEFSLLKHRPVVCVLTINVTNVTVIIIIIIIIIVVINWD